MKERVKNILKQQGMTAKELADKMGITESALSLCLNGNPTLSRIRQIAQALGVDVSELFAKQVYCPVCGAAINVKLEDPDFTKEG